MTGQRRPLILCMLISLCLMASLLLGGCFHDEMPPAIRQQVRLGLIDGTDLPFGWGYRSGKPLEVPGGYGQDVGFHGADPAKYPFVLVTQTLEIYPDETASRTAYQAWVDRAIPSAYADVWVRPPSLDYRGNADEIKIACMSMHDNGIPTQACKVTARYGEFVRPCRRVSRRSLADDVPIPTAGGAVGSAHAGCRVSASHTGAVGTRLRSATDVAGIRETGVR